MKEQENQKKREINMQKIKRTILKELMVLQSQIIIKELLNIMEKITQRELMGKYMIQKNKEEGQKNSRKRKKKKTKKKTKSKFDKKEHKWKELLYNLFYEIKSEIINSKIEIEEDEYQENINSTTIPQLVNYIHDSIQILLKKKIEDTKEEQKELDKKFYLNTNLISCEDNKEKKFQNFFEYENIIRNLESKQRILTKNYFQQKLQIDAMENKIEEYMEMEDEFEEMKTKLKYEDGRFLNNDRKDNEILIIRGENSILKTEINKLEEKVKSLEEIINTKEKKIEEINKELEKMKNKFEQKNETTNISPSININIRNVHSNSNNDINNETENSNLKKNNYNPNRIRKNKKIK